MSSMQHWYRARKKDPACCLSTTEDVNIIVTPSYSPSSVQHNEICLPVDMPPLALLEEPDVKVVVGEETTAYDIYEYKEAESVHSLTRIFIL